MKAGRPAARAKFKAGKEKDQAREGIRGTAGEGCAPLLSGAGSPRGRHSEGQKVNPDLLFRLFLRSKTLMQDSTLGPEYNVFRACPAVKNLPILPPFLFPEGAPSADNDDGPAARQSAGSLLFNGRNCRNSPPSVFQIINDLNLHRSTAGRQIYLLAVIPSPRSAALKPVDCSGDTLPGYSHFI